MIDEIKDEQLCLERMSSQEFKGMLIGKGWQVNEVASRWGLKRVRMSQILADEDRPLYYDEALRALPVRIQTQKNAE